MDLSLKRMLGMEDGGKRIYRFVSGEVTKEEYDYSQLIDALVFGKDGYVETLGPTWSLVLDPRFTAIENAFITNRSGVLGGDASTGKQYISSDGTFSSSIGELEQYSELLGEGRYFCYVISHPEKDCPVRNWYLRIFPDMVDKDAVPAASPDLQCKCTDRGYPHDVKRWSAPDTWALIQRECPNYFTEDGKPNGVAQRLFALFRADLLGLIADYAVTPMSDAYISLDTGDVFNPKERELLGETPMVFLEVDILEKALTQRAVLRATAAKILNQIDFQTTLKEELGEDFILTEYERDQVLRLVYNPTNQVGQFTIAGTPAIDPENNWYVFLNVIKTNVLSFLRSLKATGLTAEEREQKQLAEASDKAHETFVKLRSGELDVINQYTEPEVEVALDAHAEVMQALLKNPRKQELFLIYVEAESRQGDDNENHTDKLNMRRLVSILSPVFSDHEFVVDDEKFNEYLIQAEQLGLYSAPGVTEVEEEYYG